MDSQEILEKKPTRIESEIRALINLTNFHRKREDKIIVESADSVVD